MITIIIIIITTTTIIIITTIINNICSDYGLEFDIKFNQKNSFLLQFGLDQDIVLTELFIDSIALSWVAKLKYFGVYIGCC